MKPATDIELAKTLNALMRCRDYDRHGMTAPDEWDKAMEDARKAMRGRNSKGEIKES